MHGHGKSQTYSSLFYTNSLIWSAQEPWKFTVLAQENSMLGLQISGRKGGASQPRKKNSGEAL
jgi:hypothetical protein